MDGDEFPDALQGVVPLHFHGELRTVGTNKIEVDEAEAAASHPGSTWQGSVCTRLHVRPPAILAYRIETTLGFGGDLEVAMWYAQHRAESPVVLHDLGFRFRQFPHPVLEAQTSFVNAQRPVGQPDALGTAEAATAPTRDVATIGGDLKLQKGLERTKALTKEQITAGLRRSMRWATIMILKADMFSARLTECVTLLTPGGRLVQLAGYGLAAAAADLANGLPITHPPVLFLHGVATASMRSAPRQDIGSIADYRQTFLPPFFAPASRCEGTIEEDEAAGIPTDAARSAWPSWAARGAFIPAFCLFGRTTLVERLPPLPEAEYQRALARGLAITERGSFTSEELAGLRACAPEVDTAELLKATAKAERSYANRSQRAEWWGDGATEQFREDVMATFSTHWLRRRRLILWRCAARQKLRGH